MPKTRIKAIREQFLVLTNDEKIDKTSALQITRLVNALDSHYLNVIHDKDRDIENLKFQLSSENMRQDNENLNKRLSSFEQERVALLKKHKTESDELSAQLEEHLTTINRLTTRSTVVKRSLSLLLQSISGGFHDDNWVSRFVVLLLWYSQRCDRHDLDAKACLYM